MAAITLTDLVRAPLDAIYTAIDDKNIEQRKNLDRYFYRGGNSDKLDQPTYEPRHARLYMDNKWGKKDQIDVPLYLFENITQLVAQDVVVDFNINIDGFRKLSNGNIITNASVSDSNTGESSAVSKGQMKFNIRYKNVQPVGLQHIQNIQMRTFADHYQYIIDNQDEKTSEDIRVKMAYEVEQKRLMKYLQTTAINPDTLDGFFRLVEATVPLDNAKHIEYINTLIQKVLDRTGKLRRVNPLFPSLRDKNWYMCVNNNHAHIPVISRMYGECTNTSDDLVYFYASLEDIATLETGITGEESGSGSGSESGSESGDDLTAEDLVAAAGVALDNLETAQAQLAWAQTNLTTADSDVATAQNDLYSNGTLADKGALDSAQIDLTGAKTAVGTAQINVDAAQEIVDTPTIPF
jgi:hypothetical protein